MYINISAILKQIFSALKPEFIYSLPVEKSWEEFLQEVMTLITGSMEVTNLKSSPSFTVLQEQEKQTFVSLRQSLKQKRRTKSFTLTLKVVSAPNASNKSQQTTLNVSSKTFSCLHPQISPSKKKPLNNSLSTSKMK